MTTGPDFKNNLLHFYKMLNPADVYGNVRVVGSNGPADVAASELENIYKTYIEEAKSGKTIVDVVSGINTSGKGVLYTTAYQTEGNDGTKYPVGAEDYWIYEEVPPAASKGGKPTKKPAAPPAKPNTTAQPTTPTASNKKPAAKSPPPEAATGASTSDSNKPKRIANYWTQVCGQTGPMPPGTEFSVNVLRSPMLSPTRRNVDQIEFFLNYIPTIFASRMHAYMDLEMQIPMYRYESPPSDEDEKERLHRMDVDAQKAALVKEVLIQARTDAGVQPKPPRNAGKVGGKQKEADPPPAPAAPPPPRPPPVKPKIPDDKERQTLNRPSLLRFLLGSINFGTVPLTEADKSLANAQYVPGEGKRGSFFTGMEMFTSPQTLVNMDTLRASGPGAGGLGASRLVDAKPFLPPASLLSATVSLVNAGAGVFAHRSASVEIKLHDKARIAEFSEFLRGPEGYSEITIWMTYGWIAPRGGEYDMYAKFINENMLVKDAYGLKNASYSFDSVGQVTLKLELVSKGMVAIANSDVSDLNPLNAKLEALRRMAGELQKMRSALGNAPEGVNSDIRIYQIIDAAAQGNFNVDIEQEKIDSAFAATIAAVKGNPGAYPDPQRALDALTTARTLLSNGNDSALKKNALQDGALKGRFKTLTSREGADPFLPTAKKNAIDPKKIYYSADLLAAIEQKPFVPTQKKQGGGNKSSEKDKAEKFEFPPDILWERPIVSLGKVFSVFCLPVLLKHAQEEQISEVRVNFYQMNESCGPLSLHNIAEFPIDAKMFMAQFADYCTARGGSRMTITDFLGFVIESQVSDNRSPGFGMRSFYEAFDINEKEIKQMPDDEFQSKLTKWAARYPIFKKPNIAIKVETLPANELATPRGKKDLLLSMQEYVGIGSPVRKNEKKIQIIHVYDRQLNPYANVAKEFGIDKDGNFVIFDKKKAAEKKTSSADVATMADYEISHTAAAAMKEIYVKDDVVNFKGEGVGQIVSGPEEIRNFISQGLPTILIGANGSLVTNATLASKTDGLLGTIHLKGSLYKTNLTVAPNGLTTSETDLPLRLVPAQLTMTSLGCPLADLTQAYYVDFGTSTTIDNLYSVTAISHTMTPGKFETAWTFVYTDGYGKFAGAQRLSDLLYALETAAKPADPPKDEPKPAGKGGKPPQPPQKTPADPAQPTRPAKAVRTKVARPVGSTATK